MTSSFSLTQAYHKLILKAPTSPRIHATLVRPSKNINPAKDVYDDNWFDRIAIRHLSHSVQSTSGLKNNKNGYESLVESAMAVSQNLKPIQQHELVIEALNKAFPRPILYLIKTLLPSSKLAREYFAAFTALFFGWLVGPCEVRESDLNGRKEKNVVYIQKCRFLQESNCVGMCINLCKMPSQAFIKHSLGMPVNMVPNFEDMSCQMVFGQEPPAPTLDPALKQPCYKICRSRHIHSQECSN